MYRLTPRQVIVIIPRAPGDPQLAALARDLGPERLDELLLATMRDAIAASVRVDGATIAVMAPTQARLAHLRQVLPAGLEFTAPRGPIATSRMSVFALASHQGREFERIVLLDGAVLRLSSRVIGTGLGALASADVVVGASRRGSPYAFGLLERHAVHLLDADEPLIAGDRSATELVSRVRAMRLGTRRLEPLPTLDAFAIVDELRSAMASLPGVGRHVSAFLANLPWAEPAMSGHVCHVE